MIVCDEKTIFMIVKCLMKAIMSLTVADRLYLYKLHAITAPVQPSWLSTVSAKNLEGTWHRRTMTSIYKKMEQKGTFHDVQKAKLCQSCAMEWRASRSSTASRSGRRSALVGRGWHRARAETSAVKGERRACVRRNINSVETHQRNTVALPWLDHFHKCL